jgi:hypothetical protein
MVSPVKIEFDFMASQVSYEKKYLIDRIELRPVGAVYFWAGPAVAGNAARGSLRFNVECYLSSGRKRLCGLQIYQASNFTTQIEHLSGFSLPKNKLKFEL